MVNHKLIEFIEAYKKRDTEFYYNVFTVNYITREKNNWYLPFGREDKITIKLDEEDLKYLYDKYFRDYQINCNERAKERGERKRKEIKELEEQLNRLKNEK